MVQRWKVVTPVGTAWKQVPVLYGGNRPAFAHHEFLTQFLLGFYHENGRYRCFLETTCENGCSLITQNTEYKRQIGAVPNLPGRGFEPKLSATVSIISLGYMRPTDHCVFVLKRNTYDLPNQFRVQRRRCHIHYKQIVLLQC